MERKRHQIDHGSSRVLGRVLQKLEAQDFPADRIKLRGKTHAFESDIV